MRHILVAASMLSGSAVAEAAPIAIETNPFELADGKLPSGGLAPGVYKVGAATCNLTLDASGHLDIKRCEPLVGLTVQEELRQGNAVKATVRLASVGQAVLGYRSDPQRRAVLFSAPSGITELAVRNTSRGWVRIKLDDPAKPLTDADARSVVEQSREAWIIAGGVMLRVSALGPPGPALSIAPPAGGAMGATGAPPPPAAPPADWCRAPEGLTAHQLVCFEEDHGRLQLKKGPASHFLPPNRATLVIVNHAAKYAVSISMGGTAGISQPGVADYTLSGLRQHSAGVAPPPSAPVDDRQLSTQPFAPRQPGAANIRVELRTAETPATVVSDQTLELIVEQGYLGAIRMGFGVVTDNAVDRSYAAHLAPGSNQLEITRTSSGKADVELVLGFSAFVWDGRHGRRYISARSWTSLLVPAPYFGLGIVGDTPNGLQALRSLYIGGEWEPVRSFSVAIAAVGRRVTRLQDGFAVGAAVSEGTSFTEQRFELGFGVVFSVSPEFLRIASGAGAKKE